VSDCRLGGGRQDWWLSPELIRVNVTLSTGQQSAQSAFGGPSFQRLEPVPYLSRTSFLL